MNIIKFMEIIEGRRTEAYHSIEGGLPSIGIGHKLLPREHATGIIRINGQPVNWRLGLTEDQVDNLCRQDLHIASECINHNVTVQLTPGQLHALTSFVFNVGVGDRKMGVGFLGSTLLKRLNAGNFEAVPGQMRLWNKITVKKTMPDGTIMMVKEVSPVLVKRREIEIKEWLRTA